MLVNLTPGYQTDGNFPMKNSTTRKTVTDSLVNLNPGLRLLKETLCGGSRTWGNLNSILKCKNKFIVSLMRQQLLLCN